MLLHHSLKVRLRERSIKASSNKGIRTTMNQKNGILSTMSNPINIDQTMFTNIEYDKTISDHNHNRSSSKGKSEKIINTDLPKEK